jgi:hypothetical protein
VLFVWNGDFHDYLITMIFLRAQVSRTRGISPWLFPSSEERKPLWSQGVVKEAGGGIGCVEKPRGTNIFFP